MKRNFVTWSLVFTIALGIFSVLTSCKQNTNGKQGSSTVVDPVTIRVGIWPQDTDKSAMAVWKRYEQIMGEKHPNIIMEPMPFSYSFDTIIIMAASGTLPTIFQTYFTEPKRLIANRVVADISKYANDYGFTDGQRKDIREIASHNGRQYGIARDAYALALYMNLNLFRRAGLMGKDGLPVYPKTFEELIDTARTKPARQDCFCPPRTV